MEQFIHRENLQRLRRLLTETADDSQRQQIQKLLAEEEAKDHLRSEKSDARKDVGASSGLSASLQPKDAVAGFIRRLGGLLAIPIGPPLRPRQPPHDIERPPP